MDWEAFFTVHSGLDREGPGLPADVDWAARTAGLTGAVTVLDAGCGPGADTLRLAQMLPEARITALDLHPGFVEQARARVAPFGDRVRVEVGDMAKPSGQHDLIWCAGALYFLGVTEGLRGWRKALKRGGVVAFSEPVLTGPPSDAAAEFWEDYPAITGPEGIAARVAAAGFDILGTRMVQGAAWAAYYDPMRRRIAELRAGSPDAALRDAINACAREADLWEAAQDEIAYQLTLVRDAERRSDA